MNRRELGRYYEEMAAAYLVKQGYTIMERNFMSPRGEIDLIARDGVYYVFIEVKYRKDLAKGDPSEAVDTHKQSVIFQTARYYMNKNHLIEDTPCRFDVVCILGDRLQLIQNAF